MPFPLTSTNQCLAHCFFFSSRRRHTRCYRDWSSDVCSSDLGLRILNVPYKGTVPALTDVLGGQVDMMFISLVTGTAQVRAGNLRAYGVTSAQRQPSFPDLPAISEIVPGFESTAWFGVFGPAKLSTAIVDRLNAAMVAA